MILTRTCNGSTRIDFAQLLPALSFHALPVEVVIFFGESISRANWNVF